ncbi:MAG: SDR family oxidoreductase [Saprospiraceae bacterium]|nr:SDR family oxidoreductase [Saprospiraceae bacterium]MDW8485143.1 SDR family oxidoreductase [Saprospiraceae bacterium]
MQQSGNLHTPVAVVSGATKGLGRAIAERFAQAGFDLAVCARTKADLEAMQGYWVEHYPSQTLLTVPADLSQRAEVQHFANTVCSRWKRIDVLVNNAGIFRPGRICDEPEKTLEFLIEVNLYSAYHLTRALLPLMLPHQRGHIFNICSIASILAYPNGGSYTISKFALLGFSKALREELKPYGIRVTAILPGATWSDSWRGVDLPTERLMQADDIARLVWSAYELSPSAVVEEIVVRPQLGDL